MATTIVRPRQVAPIDAVIALVVRATCTFYDEEAGTIIEAWQSEVGNSGNVDADAIMRLTIALWKLTDMPEDEDALPFIPVREFAESLAAAYRGF